MNVLPNLALPYHGDRASGYAVSIRQDGAAICGGANLSNRVFRHFGVPAVRAFLGVYAAKARSVSRVLLCSSPPEVVWVYAERIATVTVKRPMSGRLWSFVAMKVKGNMGGHDALASYIHAGISILRLCAAPNPANALSGRIGLVPKCSDISLCGFHVSPIVKYVSNLFSTYYLARKETI